MKRRSACVATVAMLMSLNGCSVMNLFSSSTPKAKLTTIGVVATDDANSNMATALDLVFVYSTEAGAMLPKTAPDWFAHRDGFIAAAPTDLDVVSLQIPPAFVMKEVALPSRHSKALQVVVYANYIAAAGQNKLVLTGVKSALIRLESKSVVLSEE